MSLLRNTLTVGGATLVSRLLGFVRDTMIAAALGTGMAADAFFVAFRLPNLFRRLFAEGAFAAAFVPLRVRLAREEGEGQARRFAGEALAVLVAAVVAVTFLAVLAAPRLVDLLAPGFAEDPHKHALAVSLARICLPYLVTITVVALLSGSMTADRRFLAPALAPIVLNLVLIGGLAGILAAREIPLATAATVLSWAVIAGGLAQVGLLVVTARRAGLAPPLVRPRLSPAVRRLLRLGLPGVLSGAMNEINVVVGTIIASSTAGAVSWLYYADRLQQLPLGVVGIAIGQVLLPEIAHRIAAGDAAASHDVQNRALEFALALALPAALALALLAEPIVGVLFERGAFTATDRVAASTALAISAAGLPAFVLTRVFVPAFFAREDTTTPMVLAGVAMAVNVVLALGLEPVVGWIAVVIASAVSGWVFALALLGRLLHRRHWSIDADLLRRLPRLALAALVMAAVVGLAGRGLAGLLLGGSHLLAGSVLAGLVVLGLAVHAGLVLALGVVDRARLRDLLDAGRTRRREAACSRPEDAA